MAKEEKKPSEEKAKDFPPAEAEEKKEAPADTEKDKSDSENPPAESAQDKPDKAQADEDRKTPAEADGELPAEQSSENAEPDSAESPAAEVPAQNTELLEVKAQLAAYKSGVRGDVVEDAVCLAVHDAQKAGELTEKTVAEALTGVLERHPEWKNTAENAAGFRVGADGSQKPPASDDAIAQIFGNK